MNSHIKGRLILDSDNTRIKKPNNDCVDIMDLFSTKEEFELLILFLIKKGLIDLNEFEEFKDSVRLADKIENLNK